jgi:GGDEF domain-containing protein
LATVSTRQGSNVKRRAATLWNLFESSRRGEATHEPDAPSTTAAGPELAADDPEALADPLTGFDTHRVLMAALELALDPASPPATLAIFDLGGLDTHLDLYGRVATEQILGGLAVRLEQELGSTARLFRPRFNELVALLEGAPAHAESGVSRSVSRLNAEFAQAGLALSFGATELPGEALTPVEAMELADMRLFLHAHARRARERRSDGR